MSNSRGKSNSNKLDAQGKSKQRALILREEAMA